MKKGESKKAQIDLSFGFIFGIILIIITLFVAFLVIKSFVNIGCSANTGLLYDDLRTEVNTDWMSSGVIQKTFSETAPGGGITAVCFGSFNSSLSSDVAKNSTDAYQALRTKYQYKDKNVFVYPSDKACSSTLASYKLNHTRIDQFFCAFVKDGKISLNINKSSEEPLVTLSK